MDFDETLEELNIILGDTGNVTFTPEEKQRALQKAWKDSYVVNIVWDNSLTFDTSTYQYTLPSGITTVKDIYLSVSNTSSDFPEKISSDLWEVVEGAIQFKPKANSIIPDGHTLYLKGNYKIDYSTDSLPNAGLEEYVLALAGNNTIDLLKYKKANLFLKNDTSMSELISLGREFKQDVREARNRLQREYEAA